MNLFQTMLFLSIIINLVLLITVKQRSEEVQQLKDKNTIDIRIKE